MQAAARRSMLALAVISSERARATRGGATPATELGRLGQPARSGRERSPARHGAGRTPSQREARGDFLYHRGQGRQHLRDPQADRSERRSGRSARPRREAGALLGEGDVHDPPWHRDRPGRQRLDHRRQHVEDLRIQPDGKEAARDRGGRHSRSRGRLLQHHRRRVFARPSRSRVRRGRLLQRPCAGIRRQGCEGAGVRCQG